MYRDGEGKQFMRNVAVRKASTQNLLGTDACNIIVSPNSTQ